jgi:VanZ family protein
LISQIIAVERLNYLAAGAVLLLLVVFVNPPVQTTFVYVLHKSAHAAVFAVFALVCLKVAAKPHQVNWWKPYLGAFGVVLVCGLGTEFAQSFLNRDASLEDVFRDATGAAASLAIALLVRRWTLLRHRLRVSVVLFATVASFVAVTPLIWCVAAYANRDFVFPSILEYRSPLDIYFIEGWTANSSGVRLPPEWARRPDEKGLEVNLDTGRPGIRLVETYPDWHGYDTLSLDVTNPNPKSLRLFVRVNAQSPDYCDFHFGLEPRTRSTLRLRVDEIRLAPSCRTLNMTDVAGMSVYAPAPMLGGKFYVNRISLESSGT